VDVGDRVGEKVPAVASDLVAAHSQELVRRHPVSGQEPLHVRGWSVARLA
jgi:hypothetical protein